MAPNIGLRHMLRAGIKKPLQDRGWILRGGRTGGRRISGQPACSGSRETRIGMAPGRSRGHAH